MNITAVFAEIFTVTFVEGANGSITGDLVQEIVDGNDCTTVTAVPDSEDYVFDNWTGDLSSSDNPLTVTNVTGDMTITANFTEADINEFTVNYMGQQENNNSD